MSWKASAYIKGLIVCPNGERISRTEKLVALVLADSHQDKGRMFTFPAVKTIAEDSLMDPRVCRRILAGLERKGVIERERGEHQGRGQLTFYRFPALDEPSEKGGHVVLLLKPNKEDMASSLFLAERRTEGGRKEDKTATPPIEEQEQEQSTTTTPLPLASEGREIRKDSAHDGTTKDGTANLADDVRRVGGGVGLSAPQVAQAPDRAGTGNGEELEPAVATAVSDVCIALGIANQRKRKLLREVIELEMQGGKSPPQTAAAMIVAWNTQARRSEELRVKLGLEKFFGNGYWKDQNRWHWNEELLRERANASTGSYT